MISNNNNDMRNVLIESNPEIKAVFDQIEYENRQILSRFTHELRNPLTLVKSTIQLIESQHPEVVEYKYWNQLMSDIDDTVAILNELSLYNHCDLLQSEESDLTSLISQAVESVKPLAAPKFVNLHMVTDDNALVYQAYCCDKVKIKQVVTNLLKNAVEASLERTTIEVALSTTQSSKTSGHYINLSVTNSGEPISSEYIDHIFEPFVTTKSNGTGLGLAISQKIAQLHKGSLSVSQTDSTVTFTLQLPVEVTDNVSLSVAL